MASPARKTPDDRTVLTLLEVIGSSYRTGRSVNGALPAVDDSCVGPQYWVATMPVFRMSDAERAMARYRNGEVPMVDFVEGADVRVGYEKLLDGTLKLVPLCSSKSPAKPVAKFLYINP